MHHHRHLLYGLLWRVRQFGYGVWTTTLMLFVAAVALWPIGRFMGAQAYNSAVIVGIGAVIVMLIRRRHPGFTLDGPTMSKVYKSVAVLLLVGAIPPLIVVWVLAVLHIHP